MADIYKSKYTGEEIDSLLTKADSIEANPSGGGAEELVTFKIRDKLYYIPNSTEGTVVEANPTETGSTDLTSLKVGETVYNVPSGEGGTEVVANPTETGSTDLTSLKVGDTVYNVPSGGGGGVVERGYNINITSGSVSALNAILFNAYTANEGFSPIIIIEQPMEYSGKCSMIVIKNVGNMGTITGSLYTADGTLVTFSNISSHLNKLLYLASDVIINTYNGTND